MKSDFVVSEYLKKMVRNTLIISGLVVFVISLVVGKRALAANNPPVALPDSYTVEQDTALNVAPKGVLTNDYDSDGDAIGVKLVQTTHAGTLSINGNGSFDYVPNPGFFGMDTFLYRASDGTDDSEVVVAQIEVLKHNNPPLTGNDMYSTPLNSQLNILAAGVLFNDSDVENSKLTAQLAIAPKYGSMSLSTDGAFVYVPEFNFNGTVQMWYVANDGTSDSVLTNISILVGQNNVEPTAVDDSATTTKNIAIHIPVLTNDTDPEGYARLYSTSNRSVNLGYIDMGTSEVLYNPPPNFVGTDTFTYTMTDGSFRETAKVTVTVQDTAPVIAPPVVAPVVPPPVVAPSADNPISLIPFDSLIKSPIYSAVYWYSSDGKRYVFPNVGTYASWFPNYSNIKVISSDLMSQIPLGGNITYRPGVKMLKVPSASTVYAVDHGGVLHPIASENVIFALYGINWSRMIDDLSEAFFFAYKIGSPITSGGQFDAASMANTTPTIADNLKP
ncbi:MAG: Ig-like domain-containing protein [bacterium]